MHKYLESNSNSYKKPINNGTVKSLGMQWATKYLHNLNLNFHNSEFSDTNVLNQVMFQAGRKITITTQKLTGLMRNVSPQTWNRTEPLRSKEMKRQVYLWVCA